MKKTYSPSHGRDHHEEAELRDVFSQTPFAAHAGPCARELTEAVNCRHKTHKIKSASISVWQRSISGSLTLAEELWAANDGQQRGA